MGGSSELPRGCAYGLSSGWGEGRLTPDLGGCRVGHGPRSPHVHTPGGAEGFKGRGRRIGVAPGSRKRTRPSETFGCEQGGGRPVSGGLLILFFQKHLHLLLFASKLSQRPQPGTPSCFLYLFVALGTPKSLLLHHTSKASIFQRSAFFMVQLLETRQKQQRIGIMK